MYRLVAVTKWDQRERWPQEPRLEWAHTVTSRNFDFRIQLHKFMPADNVVIHKYKYHRKGLGRHRR